MATISKRFKLSTIIVFFVCLVVLVSLVITNLLITDTASSNIEGQLEDKAVNISLTAAESQVIRNGLQDRGDEGAIQDYAMAIQKATDVLFVVAMDMEGVRKSHPNAELIGEGFVGGDEKRVLRGEAYTSRSEGTLGESVRSFTPVFDQDQNQIGAVAVGISLEEVEAAVEENQKKILIGSLIGLLVGILGAFWLARYIKNSLFGLEPYEIARIHEERNQMLHSAYEGIIAIDKESNIVLANKSARQLLQKAGLRGREPVGMPIGEILPGATLDRVLEKKKTVLDEEQDLNGLSIISNQVPLLVNDNVIGAMVTFRDKTELNRLAEQLTGVEMYAETLRAQSHEFMNQLHVVLGMIKLEEYEQVAGFIAKLVDHQVHEVGTIAHHLKDAVFAGFMIGKISYAREAHVELSVSCETEIPKPENPEVTHELITIAGNIIDNAIDNVADKESGHIQASFSYIDDLLTMAITDNGTGIPEEQQDAIFTKGVSNKAGHDRGYGLYLVKKAVEKLDGSVEVRSEPNKGSTFEIIIPYEAGGDSDD